MLMRPSRIMRAATRPSRSAVARPGADLGVEVDAGHRRPAPGRRRSARRRPPARRGHAREGRARPRGSGATATSSALMSAAVARGPARPAVAGDARAPGSAPRRGPRRSIRGAPAGRAAAPGPAMRRGPRQGVLDGDAHVRESELSLEGAVDELDERVDEALGVDEDVDPLVGDIVQPARLDDLQALVHERRGIDGDLGAHRPGRVRQGVRGRGRRQPLGRPSRGTDRPMRSGAAARPIAIRSPGQALPERRVLRVDGPDPGQRAGHRVGRVDRRARAAARPRASGITRWPPATSVSLLAVATDLARAQRGEHRPEADDAAGGHDDQVHVVAGREALERVRVRGRASCRPAARARASAAGSASAATSGPHGSELAPRRSSTSRPAAMATPGTRPGPRS